MAIRGTVLIHHNPQTRQLEVIAENLGESPGALTHNCFRSLQEAQTSKVHDDMRYGHGDPVPGGTDQQPGIMRRSFPIGDLYNQSARIDTGSWFRVGFRGRAWKPVQIPAPGQTVVVPYEDMNATGAWAPQRFDRTSRIGGPLAALYAALNHGQKHLTVGEVRIVPVPDPRKPNQLKGWEVEVENQANFEPQKGQTTGFSATVVLVNAEGKGTKNAGLGLESMGCPAGGYTAKQFILFNGDYGVREHGVRAQPGTRVRLGVRGLSGFETQLPSLAEGARRIGLHEFKEVKGDLVSAWFESKEILGKLGEKKGRVEFFKDGRKINDELPDTVFHGEEAFIRAEFKDPPRVVIEWVPPDDDLPKGGWRATMENLLPEEDKLGRVGFVGGLALGLKGHRIQADEAALPPRQFSPETRHHRWTIPADAVIGGVPAAAGLELAVTTGPLGWRGRIRLPREGEIVDTHGSHAVMERVWTLRETDFHRAKLYPPEIYRGPLGAQKAPQPAPELSVRAVPDGEQTPGGGWVIELKTRMPAEDKDGQMGFVGTLKLGRSGKDPAALPPKKFTAPDQTNTWFLPRGQKVGEHAAEAGAELVVGGRGTGWYVAVPLPKEGQEVSAEDLADRWAFRADQYDRDRLSLAEVQKTRQGPDPVPVPVVPEAVPGAAVPGAAVPGAAAPAAAVPVVDPGAR